jgi:hypothetical protein
MRRTILLLFLCLAAFSFFSCAQENSKKIWVGILPVADASGEPQAEIFGQYLTGRIFHELQSTSIEPVLLNPGGLYNPLSSGWTIEFSHRIGVDLVVISSILPTDKPKKGNWTLKVQTELMEISTGKTSVTVLHTFDIDRRVVLSDYWKTGRTDSPRDYLHGGSDTGTHMVLFGDKPFEKQPLGAAAKDTAESIRKFVVATAPELTANRSAPAMVVKGGPCEVMFGVRYSKRKSTAYDLYVNGRNESIGMVDGISKLSLNSGPILVHVTVHDVPYRLPVQHLYQANSYVNCSAQNHTLALVIGPTGEATLEWE